MSITMRPSQIPYAVVQVEANKSPLPLHATTTTTHNDQLPSGPSMRKSTACSCGSSVVTCSLATSVMSSSSGPYIPVHRWEHSTSSSSLPEISSTLPRDNRPIYTISDMLLLASSPLSKLSREGLNTLRATAPEIVQSQRGRKTHEWNMSFGPYWPGNPRRRPQFPLRPRSNTCASEGEGQGWRK
ncbi:hypothetical protein BDR04DRAFT_142331 [Suillus decipiens]|nr:hypothetical protein BDR04DRAFT_142331 [Suillus decipiens]